MNGYGEGSPEGFKAFFARYCPGCAQGREAGREVHPQGFHTEEVGTPRQGAVSGAVEGEGAGVRRETQRRDAAQRGRARAAGALGHHGQDGRNGHAGLEPQGRLLSGDEVGLPYAENDKGRERCVWIPAGLVIPCFQRDAAGKSVLKRIKVRYPTRNWRRRGNTSM